jgi:hypothetical protein
MLLKTLLNSLLQFHRLLLAKYLVPSSHGIWMLF